MYLIINFKQNLNEKLFREYIDEVQFYIKENPLSFSLVLCPPFPYLQLFYSKFKDFPSVFIGAQDVSKYSSGSHTGQISAFQLSDFCQFCIVNHSETLLPDSPDLNGLADKLKNLETAEIKPLICTKEYSRRFEESLKEDSIVCYEDPNHIGGVEANSTEEIALFYQKFETKPKFLYGGSVTPENVSALLKLDFLSGLLVATAALKPEGLLSIIKKIEYENTEK